jgi:signal transduction histidine kinase
MNRYDKKEKRTLAVSQKLAEANGGRIVVDSEAGKGSTFTVWLPVKP